MDENEAEKLKVQQEIAKSNTRYIVFEVSAIDGRGLKIEQYSTERSLIIRKYKHGEKNMGYLPIKAWGKKWNISLSRNGERIWDIPQVFFIEILWNISIYDNVS